MIRRTAFVAAAFFAALAATAQAPGPELFKVDPVHSRVGFRIRHIVGKVSGTFAEFSGTVTVPDRAAAELASASFTIKAASIDTANGDRDKHLRSPDFFDAERFPEIAFASTKIVAKGDGRYEVTGKFTMHGVTREITLPVAFNGFAKDPWGNERAGFSLQGTLNRKDYGIVWNKTLDQGGLMLGEEVEITIDLETVKAKPGK